VDVGLRVHDGFGIDTTCRHVLEGGSDKASALNELHTVPASARPAGFLFEIFKTCRDSGGGDLLEDAPSPVIVDARNDARILDEAVGQIEGGAA
jgi:hypothetical protein